MISNSTFVLFLVFALLSLAFDKSFAVDSTEKRLKPVLTGDSQVVSDGDIIPIDTPIDFDEEEKAANGARAALRDVSYCRARLLVRPVRRCSSNTRCQSGCRVGYFMSGYWNSGTMLGSYKECSENCESHYDMCVSKCEGVQQSAVSSGGCKCNRNPILTPALLSFCKAACQAGQQKCQSGCRGARCPLTATTRVWWGVSVTGKCGPLCH